MATEDLPAFRAASPRHVKIIATAGPATAAPERLRELLDSGVDVLRLNFSHGSQDEHGRVFSAARDAARQLGRQVAILQDLQGPRIRVSGLPGDVPLELTPGQVLLIAGRASAGETPAISTNYPLLHQVVSPGSRILIDDGRIELRVREINAATVTTEVVAGGLLQAHKGVNLPGARLRIPAFTEKDEADLEFGLALGVDWIALSFVQDGEDVRALRRAMKRRGVRIPVLAKIERSEALGNLHEILRAFDGVMVARGDLGIELPPEEVPVWQKTIVREARQLGKVSVVATQMLDSMIENPRATRAEVSDVANAVLDGADAVMLSGETSIGSYPLESVRLMARIIERAEAVYPAFDLPEPQLLSSAGAVAQAACVLAGSLRCQALVVLTKSGLTARSVSVRRPITPVIAFTDREQMARQLALRWGVLPLVMQFPLSTEDALSVMEDCLGSLGLVKRGDRVIVVGATPLAARGPTNFLKVHRIG